MTCPYMSPAHPNWRYSQLYFRYAYDRVFVLSSFHCRREIKVAKNWFRETSHELISTNIIKVSMIIAWMNGECAGRIPDPFSRKDFLVHTTKGVPRCPGGNMHYTYLKWNPERKIIKEDTMLGPKDANSQTSPLPCPPRLLQQHSMSTSSLCRYFPPMTRSPPICNVHSFACLPVGLFRTEGLSWLLEFYFLEPPPSLEAKNAHLRRKRCLASAKTLAEAFRSLGPSFWPGRCSGVATVTRQA
jgi:hypothetical protein